VEQSELLAFVLQLLERLKIPHMVVGSFASIAYGEPRMTQDIDIVIDPSQDQLEAICKAFPEDEFYVSSEAARDALRRRSQFNVIHPTSGNKIDFMIAHNDEWGRTQLENRRRIRILPDQEGFAGRPEDIILSKMLYYQEGGSEKHLRDITGMLKISPELIDRQYIARWAKELGVTDIWEAILRRVASGSGSG
jgi:hypothetical protein